MHMRPLRGLSPIGSANYLAATETGIASINFVGNFEENFEGQGTMSEDAFESYNEKQENPSTPQKPIRCDAGNCGHPAIASLELRRFCVDHFISQCYERLNRCSATPFADPDEATSVSIDRFLNSCAQQAAGLVHPMRGLDNLERARLFDILLWSSELARKRGVFRTEKAAGASS
jgi:hypothetical protein